MFITPCSICQTALSAFSYQFHPFFQGTPWSTFITCLLYTSKIEKTDTDDYILTLNGKAV